MKVKLIHFPINKNYTPCDSAYIKSVEIEVRLPLEGIGIARGEYFSITNHPTN